MSTAERPMNRELATRDGIPTFCSGRDFGRAAGLLPREE
jgi:hypothetical protein